LSASLSSGKIIEYGCGTGNVLLHYKDKYEVTGVDLSSGMLEQAKFKIPNGNFHLENMVTFKTDERYDVALCLYDSINHILNFSDWFIFFRNVLNTLKPNGIFILDVNTTERLKGVEKRPTLFNEFDDNYFYMKLKKKRENNFIFDVRVLKKVGDKTFEEEKEEIEETTETGSRIFQALKEVFPDVTAYNEKKEIIQEAEFPENEKYRWFYSCKKASAV
jgi:SAM-dependent methyltransferase